jgi:Spy/CpxP family protein refolding chaperone
VKNTLIVTTLSLMMCVAGTAFADSTPGSDPIGDALIPPEVVMSHQQELGLSDAQLHAIRDDVLSAQHRFTTSQFELAAAQETLVGIIKQNRIDQPKALSALDDVLKLERDVKRAQLTLMIQIKNELTPDQQARARNFVPSAQK